MTSGPPAVADLAAAVDLLSGIRGVGTVRQALRAVLRGWGFTDADWLDAAALVAGELVSNAVRHAGGGRALLLRARGGHVWVSVVDGSSARPVRSSTEGADGGRGLLIVEALSVRWGSAGHPGGKRVWARLVPYPELRY